LDAGENTLAKGKLSMRMQFRGVVAAAGVAAFLAVGGQGIVFAETGTNVSTDETKSGDATAKLYALSRDLVEYGRKNKDALSLIVAAGMRQQVSLKAVDRKPKSDASAPAAADNSPDLTVDAILAEAKTMSGNDDMIVALAKDVTASATKGRSAGPGYNVATIAAKSTDSYDSVSFDGGDYAEVYTEGSGRSNLDLYVYDENGNLICSDTDSTDIGYCGWTPRWTGGFTIKVVNRGTSSNKYALITN
jgi:hypothetical protein